MAPRMARMWSGVLPQLPPKKNTPATNNKATPRTISSGVSLYTTFMSTRHGCPAFGCAITGSDVAER